MSTRHALTSADPRPPARHVLVHAFGDQPDSLTTALRVARQAVFELEPNTTFQIVVQGPLVRLLASGSELADDIGSTISDTVTVIACRNSMDRAGLSESELLTGLDTVPSAGAYLAARQWDGWAYLRY